MYGLIIPRGVSQADIRLGWKRSKRASAVAMKSWKLRVRFRTSLFSNPGDKLPPGPD